MKSLMQLVRHIRGRIRRWYRKTFHKNWGVVEHGLYFFQEFADIYGDSINDIDSAERFFADFMQETGGWVIVDFLDTDNCDGVHHTQHSPRPLDLSCSGGCPPRRSLSSVHEEELSSA